MESSTSDLVFVRLFEGTRIRQLGDGRELVVQHAGELGWACYIPGDTKPVTTAETPEEAIVEHLGMNRDKPPEWVVRLSASFMADLYSTERYRCNCCGFRTLLRKGSYDICKVCGWEDDPMAGPDNPDETNGANHISLREGRRNFKRFRASTRKRLDRVRDPRPEERE